MILTTANDFLSEPIQIADLSDSGVLSNFQNVQSVSEQSYLIDLLGYEIYKNLMVGVVGVYDEENEVYIIDPIWLNLKNGVEFTDSLGNLNKFDGLANMLKYFVWFEYQKTKNESYTSTGAVEYNNPNSERIKTFQKARTNYNEGVKRSNILRDYITISGVYGTLKGKELKFVLW